MTTPQVTPVQNFLTIEQLPEAGQRTGAEVVEVIQDGKSRKMALSEVVKFDNYDLKSSVTTGVCDTAVSQTFFVDNSTAGTRAITFVGLPAGRSKAVIVKVKGNAGTVTWPAGIIWNNDVAPEMGAEATLVTLYWDGTVLMGAQGATK